MEPRHTDTRNPARPHIFKERGNRGNAGSLWCDDERDSGQAAKRRTKQAVRSSRPRGLRSPPRWLLPPSAACLSVSGARQSAASYSSRAPPKTKKRRRAERTGPATAGLDPQRGAIRQPASARRSGGPTDDRAHAGGGTRRHAASVPSMSRAT